MMRDKLAKINILLAKSAGNWRYAGSYEVLLNMKFFKEFCDFCLVKLSHFSKFL